MLEKAVAAAEAPLVDSDTESMAAPPVPQALHVGTPTRFFFAIPKPRNGLFAWLRKRDMILYELTLDLPLAQITPERTGSVFALWGEPPGAPTMMSPLDGTYTRTASHLILTTEQFVLTLDPDSSACTESWGRIQHHELGEQKVRIWFDEPE